MGLLRAEQTSSFARNSLQPKGITVKNKETTSHRNQPALLFIPDISGFTQFVTQTEINHSGHIIEELLSIIMDANEIGLEVNEVEGDAILFFRLGTAPTAAELLNQVQKMFVCFHAHLKRYHTHRVCNCGACRTAHALTLKFVVHYGMISLNTVRQYKKLFGSDVIIAHRLLKNDISHHEYALFTNALVKACPQWVSIDTTSWAPVYHGEQEYDSGAVSYCYLSLSPLMDLIPLPAMEDYSIPGIKAQVMESEVMIAAPIDLVFNVISDLPWRSKLIPGALDQIQNLNSMLTQHGQTHRCLANGPVIVAHDFKSTDNIIAFTETDTKRTYCVVFTLNRISESQTHLKAVAFMKRHSLQALIFKLFMKRKVEGIYAQAWANLSVYCASLMEKAQPHHYALDLERSREVLI